MTGNVLDLIDHVVAEHELLSGDAMRWAPDAPDPTPAGPEPVPITLRLACTMTPTGMKLRLDVAHLRDQLRPRYGRHTGRAVRKLLAAANPRPPRAHPRISRMHSDYHRRTRRSVHR